MPCSLRCTAPCFSISPTHEAPSRSEEVQDGRVIARQVFASGSVDRTIRIWDTRDRSKPQLTVLAHDTVRRLPDSHRVAVMILTHDENLTTEDENMHHMEAKQCQGCETTGLLVQAYGTS